MLTQEKIIELANFAVEQRESLDKPVVKTRAKKKKNPLNPFLDENKSPFFPAYLNIVQELKRVLVHSDARMPLELFESDSPLETAEERQYKKDNYKAITTASWDAALSKVVGKIWNPTNFTIQWPDPEQAEYFTEDYPIGGNLVNWIATVESPFKMRDPNAVKVHIPLRMPDSDNEELQPVAKIWPSPNVIQRGRTFVLILRNDRVKMKDDKEGLILELYDDHNIYIIRQVDSKPNFNIMPLFREPEGHGLGEAPFIFLKGRPSTDAQGDDFFRSYFFPAVHHLDQAVLDNTSLSIVKHRMAHPMMAIAQDKCNYRDPESGTACLSGYIFTHVDEETKQQRFKRCPQCLEQSKSSQVQRAIVVNPRSSGDDREPLPFPPIAFAEQSYESPKLLQDQIEKEIIQGWLALNIDFRNRFQPSTATEKRINLDEQHAFLMQISNELFESLAFSIRIIGKMKWCLPGSPEDCFQEPIITKPIKFDLMGPVELEKELAEVIQNQLPIGTRVSVREQLDQARFNYTPQQEEKHKTIQFSDENYDLTDQEINTNKLMGTIEPWEITLHYKANAIFNEIINEDPDFLEKPIEERKEIMIAVAKQKTPPPRVNNTTANILEQANGQTT